MRPEPESEPNNPTWSPNSRAGVGLHRDLSKLQPESKLNLNKRTWCAQTPPPSLQLSRHRHRRRSGCRRRTFTVVAPSSDISFSISRVRN
ncbi:hypothetical protein Hanom_Chr04g00290651 [Helianthus anomalus]